jgi:signal transduction histidine kinase/HD-like signal output (HDOD) protein
MPATQQNARARQIELILQQVDTLPTLSPIAARLLQITSPVDADLDEIVQLIETDPAMTGKILGLCRRADRGLGDRITTVRRAVVMLGLEAVQSAVLSVTVYELMEHAATTAGRDMDGPEGVLPHGPEHAFDRVGFWKHCVAVAAASELIAESHGRLGVAPEEAFVAGLLHALGKMALDLILPRAYRRVLGLAERRRIGSAGAERDVLGIDHHTAGRRLAEHWCLPHALQDVMWLYGQPASTLPDLPHKRLIGVVSVALVLCRSLHLGWSGDFSTPRPVAGMCHEYGIDAVLVDDIVPRLHDAVASRCKLLGVDDQTPPQLLMQSIAVANRQLSRLNGLLQARARQSQRQSRVLDAITSFHSAWQPGRSVGDAAAAIVRSASNLLGPGLYAVLFQARSGERAEPWQLCQVAPDGASMRTRMVEPPGGKDGRDALSFLADPTRFNLSAMSLLPWLAEYLGKREEVRRLHILPLLSTGSAGPVTVLLHDRDLSEWGGETNLLAAVTGSWTAAITAAAQHEGARRLGERLADSNRSLAEAQHHLAEAQSLARLGEMAAGAAHEMNNPLTVISGRSQLLSETATNERDRAAALAIVEAAHHLTDLISSLRLLSDPPKPVMSPTRLDELVKQAVALAEERTSQPGRVTLDVANPSPVAVLDRELIAMALAEAVANALESSSDTPVTVRVQTGLPDARLMIVVEDRGIGMSAKTLQHAFDPFYSDKPAGRQTGLGLTRARRLVDLHHGELSLRSTPEQGTIATFVLPTAQPTMSRGRSGAFADRAA